MSRLRDTDDELEAIRTPPGYPSVKALSAMVQQECRRDGPAAELWEAIGKMRDENAARDKLLSEFVGAQKLARWLVPMVASLASSALAVFLMKALMGLR